MLMKGKKGIVMGVANKMSIAWGITDKLIQEGAEVILTYPNAAIEKRIRNLTANVEIQDVLLCDVSDKESINGLFDDVAKIWDNIDFIVHAIAFSDKDELNNGGYVNTSRENFLNTMNISCYSLCSIVNKAQHLMKNGGSVIALTYIGANRVIPHYNVMGVAKAALEASVKYLAYDLGHKNIRVNAISAGPVRTLASAGIGDFKHIMTWNENNAPLERGITIDEVGNSALYLLSDLGSGTTGDSIFVDGGYHVLGMCSERYLLKQLQDQDEKSSK